MKRTILLFSALFFSILACKKDKADGQKCVWNVIFNNRVAYEWLDKPSDAQKKKIEDSCACSISVNEVCFSCSTSVTTTGGVDVQCR